MASCFSQGDCIIVSTNVMKVGLQKKLDGKPKLTTFIRIQEIDEGGVLDLDTLEGRELSVLPLPLNPNYTESTFVFVTSDLLTYHLSLHYTHFTRIIATDCGAFTYYENLSVVQTDFDSTRLVNPQLYKSVPTNLQVFF